MANKFNFTDWKKYGEELKDPRWEEKRQKILERDNHQCVICGAKEKLHVHHKQYHFIRRADDFKKPWDYPDKIYITVCEKCHKIGHALYKVPIKYI